MAGRKKGLPKTGGRLKGSPNKKTKLWNELGEYIVNEGAEKYMDYLKEMENEEFLKRFEAILEYFKPKQARTEVTGKDGEALTVVLGNR